MKVRFKNKKVNVDSILNRLHDIYKINEKGQIEFDAFDKEEIVWILLSNIKFDFSTNAENKHVLCMNVLKECVINKIRKKDGFIRTFNNEIKKHYSKPEKDYYLLSSLSVSYLPFRKLTLGDCLIRITGKKYPKNFKSKRDKCDSKFNDEGYLKVVVTTKGNDINDSFEKMEEALNVFRAIISFEVNATFGKISGPSIAINKIMLGNLFTVHNSESVVEGHWYNNSKIQKIYNDPKLKEVDFKKN